jgi:tetratricopeptide (TPR) repeat protein
MTSRYGVPNACTTCHEDKSPEWAAATMDTWYGDGARRRATVAMADVFYRAGTGDVGVLPDVARLATDRSHGALIRASAAEFAGQLLARQEAGPAKAGHYVRSTLGADDDTRSVRLQPDDGPAPAGTDTSVANALFGAASDPEPMVRVTAVRALALVRDARVAPVIAAHLKDPARLVRVSAAEALMALGISRLSGEAGEALAQAQDEWEASLATFGDVANDHTTLGWLEASRGRVEEGTKELEIASALDNTDARPHMYLGVLAAAAGRYDEAMKHLKIAQKLAPGSQNLDRLIEEVQKRTPIRD